MAAIVLSFRYILGVTFLRKRGLVSMAWLLCQKEWKKVGGAAPLYLFWTIWKERNRISFEDKDLSDQRRKSLLLCNLLSWTKWYIVEGPMSLFDFVDWLGSYWGGGSGFLLSIFLFLFTPFGNLCIYILCTLVRSFLLILFILSLITH